MLKFFMKSKYLPILLATGTMMGGCVSSRNSSWRSDSPIDNSIYSKSSKKIDYAIPSRADVNIGGGRDSVGPVKDLTKGLISLDFLPVLSSEEWANNPYYTSGILIKGLLFSVGAAGVFDGGSITHGIGNSYNNLPVKIIEGGSGTVAY